MNKKSGLKIKLVKAKEMFPLIEKLLHKGIRVRITVTGTSMYPFLREGMDSVLLANTDFDKLRAGDIVLIQRDSGEYILHRIVHKWSHHIDIMGDAQQQEKERIYRHQVIAKALRIYRKNRRISCEAYYWRFLSLVWIRMIPYRHRIFRLYRSIRELATDCLRRVASWKV